jgi:AcrR family transcriptional regulator
MAAAGRRSSRRSLRVRAGVGVEPVLRLRSGGSGGGCVLPSRVAEVQRARILVAAVEIASELGYGAMSAGRVSARAGVSRKTFYELFEDREDCFLAVFDEAVERATAIAQGAAREQDGWRAQIRAGLSALLGFLDEESGLGSLLVVGVLGAGPRVLERRARVLEGLAVVVDAGRPKAASPGGPPPLTAEGLVGAVLSVVHARMLEGESVVGMLSPLMGMIVLPYVGQAAARKELARPAPKTRRAVRHAQRAPVEQHPLKSLEIRLTYRTLLVISAVAGQPGANNREIAERAGITDQGQISKLLARLERLGITENTAIGHAQGEPNAWRLTPRGSQLEQSTRIEDHRRAA